MPKKSEIASTTRIVRFDTALPFADVIARLDVAVNKKGSRDIMAQLKRVTSQEELAAVVQRTIHGDFLYFFEFPLHKLLQFADGEDKPAIVAYTIGNPLIAQTIIPHNSWAAHSIPPRLLVVENPDHSGASVFYQLPSSVMSVLVGDNHPTLQVALEALDRKLEALALKITAEGPAATL